MIHLLISLDGISHSLFSRHYEKLAAGLGTHAYAEQLQTINPSVTFPVHMSAITGMYPETHGIYENVIFPQHPYTRTALYHVTDSAAAGLIGTKTLVHFLMARGIECKMIHWPLGNGFPCASVCDSGIVHDQAESIAQAAENDAESVRELKALLGNNKEDVKVFAAAHFTEYDAAAHIYGMKHPRTKAAFSRIQNYMKQIMNEVHKTETGNVIFFSDHGFADRTDTFFPNIYAASCGFEQNLKDGSFRFLCDGSGSALYYSILPKEKDVEILNQIAGSTKVTGYRWIGKSAKSTGTPKAIINMKTGVCAEDIMPGKPPQYPDMKGIHGYDPAIAAAMNGFLLICGKRIKVTSDKAVSVIDLAPTIADWYGYHYDCSGKIID